MYMASVFSHSLRNRIPARHISRNAPFHFQFNRIDTNATFYLCVSKGIQEIFHYFVLFITINIIITSIIIPINIITCRNWLLSPRIHMLSSEGADTGTKSWLLICMPIYSHTNYFNSITILYIIK